MGVQCQQPAQGRIHHSDRGGLHTVMSAIVARDRPLPHGYFTTAQVDNQAVYPVSIFLSEGQR